TPRTAPANSGRATTLLAESKEQCIRGASPAPSRACVTGQWVQPNPPENSLESYAFPSFACGAPTLTIGLPGARLYTCSVGRMAGVPLARSLLPGGIGSATDGGKGDGIRQETDRKVRTARWIPERVLGRGDFARHAVRRSREGTAARRHGSLRRQPAEGNRRRPDPRRPRLARRG